LQEETKLEKPTTRLPFFLAFLPLLVVTACNTGDWDTGPPQTESRTVKLGEAKSARVEIEMPAGELSVGPGAQELLEADFTYHNMSAKPLVEYNVNDGQGRLSIRQPESSHGHGGSHNRWDLHLSNKVPMQLEVNQGAGRAKLILGGLALTTLDLRIGAGETTVDLTGDWKNDLTANIQGGVGRATVRLPSDVGVRATAHGGIGAVRVHGLRKEGDAYVNEAYGKSPVTVNVTVEGGVGEINLELGEAPPSV
jgi:hypothetical protein